MVKIVHALRREMKMASCVDSVSRVRLKRCHDRKLCSALFTNRSEELALWYTNIADPSPGLENFDQEGTHLGN